MKQILLTLPLLVTAGCSQLEVQEFFGITPDAAPETAVDAAMAPEAQEVTPQVRPAPPPPPPPTARTVEQFDTTTAADRQEAVTVEAVATETALGTTLATLGNAADPGIWLKTPLVSTVTAGRVAYQGNEINIELRPSGGAAGSGSQISLAAMRLLEAPLTGIVTLEVFAR